jgi:hypothetical protein
MRFLQEGADFGLNPDDGEPELVNSDARCAGTNRFKSNGRVCAQVFEDTAGLKWSALADDFRTLLLMFDEGSESVFQQFMA